MKAPKQSNQDSEGPAKPLRKLLLLTLLKEGYLLLRNYYGLLVHPSKTVFKICREPDWSQTILVFGLPIYFWIGIIFVLAVFRFFLGIRGNLGWIVQASIVLVTLFAGILSVYLVLFLFITLRKFDKRK